MAAGSFSMPIAPSAPEDNRGCLPAPDRALDPWDRERLARTAHPRRWCRGLSIAHATSSRSGQLLLAAVCSACHPMRRQSVRRGCCACWIRRRVRPATSDLERDQFRRWSECIEAAGPGCRRSGGLGLSTRPGNGRLASPALVQPPRANRKPPLTTDNIPTCGILPGRCRRRTWS